MGRLITLYLFFSIVAITNPFITSVINEFQTDTTSGQKFEFHPIDYGSAIPLFGTRVYTLAVLLMLIQIFSIHHMDIR
ncbi:MAG: hypothetical protein N3A65_06715 [candidate division WOR-3 bacterium]|nr:hypothetical protein [candidate division WOR-3 bacterium]